MDSLRAQLFTTTLSDFSVNILDHCSRFARLASARIGMADCLMVRTIASPDLSSPMEPQHVVILRHRRDIFLGQSPHFSSCGHELSRMVVP
jgi:hypothetical protein